MQADAHPQQWPRGEADRGPARTWLAAQPESMVMVLPWKFRPVMLLKLKGWELCVQANPPMYV